MGISFCILERNYVGERNLHATLYDESKHKPWSTNMEQILTQNNILIEFSLNVLIHYIIHLLQYVSHILPPYASHAALRCKTLLRKMFW